MMILGMQDKGWSPTKQTEQMTYVFLTLGIGECFGVIISGQIIDRYGNHIAIYSSLIQTILAFSFLIWYTFNNTFVLGTACTLSFLWGFQDANLNNFIVCVCGFEFESKIIPFSLTYGLSAILGAVTIWLSSYVKEK